MLAHAILTADALHGVLQLWAEDSASVGHDLDARRHHVTTSVEIDLDGFKQYSGTQWRAAADEFVLILPATGRTQARRRGAVPREGGKEQGRYLVSRR